MSDSTVYARNSRALSSMPGPHPTAVPYLAEHPGFKIVQARSGAPVPVLLRGGTGYPLHSTFDPDKEAQRLSEGSPRGGFIACYGLGGGYHLRKLLASPSVTGLLVIDFSMELFSSLISGIDLSDILSDPRLSILIDPDDQAIGSCLAERYLPFLSGPFSTLPLRSRVDLDRNAFEAAAASVSRFLSNASGDYTVQSTFGKAWFRNVVSNLERAQTPQPPIPRVREALVCAAGPSLEDQAAELSERSSAGAFLIATDTSLPFLRGRGILPDAVITLDCQHISYYHFMNGYPRGTPLVMDLASPPLLSRIASPVHFFSSGHPFCRYLSSRWRPFPLLDTSGGNVSHAALSLAHALGASVIRLYAADFSYPRGKCYARGTYIYRHFESRALRTRPVESLFAEFLFRNPKLARDGAGASLCYRTSTLDLYRRRLESYASTLDCDFIPVRGQGSPVTESLNASTPPRAQASPFFSVVGTGGDFRDFLMRYRSALAALSSPGEPALERLRALPAGERDLWTTLFPQAAAFSRAVAGGGMGGSELLMETKDWTIGLVDEVLGRSRRS